MQLNSIRNRLKMLESRQQQPSSEPLQDRTARYMAIMDNEDYDSSADGRALKATIEKYEQVITELEETET